MPRRGESIYKRSDGRWEARYIHHYENGKAKYRYVYANTYTEAKEKRLEDLRIMEKALEAASRRDATFEELATLWLSEIRPNVKESTYTRYHRTVHRYLNPNLAEIKIVKLDYQFLKLFSRDLLDHGGKNHKPLSAKTVNDILCVVKSIFRFGRMYGFPCAEVSALSCSSRHRKPTNILDPEKRKELEQKLMNSEKSDSKDRVRLGILFTLYTGLRIGELCGLRFGDIDFRAKTVTIKRTVERILNLEKNAISRTRLVIGEPKTEQSIRTIPLPSFLVSYLEQYKLDDKLYFLTASEKPTEPNLFYMRYRNYMRRNGMEGYSFHALRHTFATRCIEIGFDVKSLSEILGHANVSTTLSIYVHPTMEQKRKQMEWLAPDEESFYF